MEITKNTITWPQCVAHTTQCFDQPSNPCWICGGESGTGAGLSRVLPLLPPVCIIAPNPQPHSIHPSPASLSDRVVQ